MAEVASHPEVCDDISKYGEIVCTPDDLIRISNEINKSAREVCRSLQLEEKVMDEIEKQGGEEYHKVYSAFVAWCEQGERRTWGELASQLTNNEELLRTVKIYLVENQPRKKDMPESNLFLCSVEETQYGACGPTEVAVEQRISSHQPQLHVTKNYRDLKDSFGDILIEAQKALASQPNITENVRLRLTRLCVDDEDHIPLFDHITCSLLQKMDIHSMLNLMTKNKAWDPINFRILYILLKKFVPPEHNVHDFMEQYSNTVQRFQRTTLLIDYMAVAGGNKCYPRGYTTVTAKIAKQYKSYTMAQFAEDEQFVAKEFHIHPSVFQFKKSEGGCVCIVWFIPKSALQLLEPSRINWRWELLKKKDIIEIIVDERFIYRIPHVVIPTPYSVPSATDVEKLDYKTMYDASVSKPDEFWGYNAKKILTWMKMFQEVNGCQTDKGIISWFSGGQLNVSVNCLDRHIEKYGDRTALIWEKNRKKEQKRGTHECVSYRKLLEMTCRMANVLRTTCGVKKGDRVIIYMSTCPLAVAAMLACARIGAVHCVLYPVLEKCDLENRIRSSEAKVVVTAVKVVVGDKQLHLKQTVDATLTCLEKENTVQHVLVMKTGDTAYEPLPRDIDLEMAMNAVPSYCAAEAMESEDPLFIMYTSGTTDEPTGIVHTQAGYLLSAAMTHKYVFDYKEGEVFACVSDLGWIAAHTYTVYGPLCNGATTVLFEGTATYPDSGRYWEMVERLKINHFYTSPAAIRKLMKENRDCVGSYDVSSLRTIASGGEPLSTATWLWFYSAVGKQKCVLIDTYGQTELGGIALSPQPGPADCKFKPGICARPFFGVEPLITDEKGNILQEKGVQGLLCLKNPIPAMGRKLVKGSFKEKYFTTFPGKYFTGDWAYRDIDGDYQIVGRKDDIVRIKGVWVQVPEIESSIAESSENIESASFIGLLNETNGNTDTCVVVELSKTIAETKRKSKALYQEIISRVKNSIIRFAGEDALPKFVLVVKKNIHTLSDKICRNIWRDWASAEMFKPWLHKVNKSENIALLDFSGCSLPAMVGRKWQHLFTR